MRTLRLIGMALLALCITACSDGEEEQDAPTPQKPDESTITIDTSIITVAGTLRNLLGDQYLKIEALKIIGPLNGDDIRIIREMGGSDYEGYSTSGKLSYLDLSDASIVKGGKYYSGDAPGYYPAFNDEIGYYMFCKCSQLKTITLPNSVTIIKENAFQDCTGLTSITIPNSVTIIGGCAFENCTGLTSITIPNSVATIRKYAFHKCTGLTSVTIPNSVTTIGERAFSRCTGLTSITIPNSVTTIEYGAFENCTGLTSVNIGSGVTTIGSRAFENCTGLTSITIPNSVTTIGGYAFAVCTGLTSITIPNSVATIGEGAFINCTGLTSITIPNSVATIGEGAFEGCSGLTSVTIGSGVTTIGEGAFYKCPIKKCHIYATTPPKKSSAAFSDNTVYAESTLYVPKGCVDIYKKAGWERDFYNIVEMN